MEKRNQLIIDLTDKLKAFKSVPVDFETVSVSPVALDSFVKLPEDIDILFRIKGESVRGAMIVTPTESTAILRDKMRQIKEFVVDKPYILPFIGGRFFGERDRNIAMMEGVNLFDLAGNIYLNMPQLHYESIVTKNPFPKPTLKELFAPVSSRIVRVLLVDPKKKWFISDLAKEADVSLALAYRIVVKLLEDKLLEKATTKEVIVKSPGEILDRWVQAKNSYLSYKQQKYGFYSLKKIPEMLGLIATRNKDQFMKYGLSFSTGAYLVSPYLTELNKMQLYISSSIELTSWEKVLELTPVDRGANIEIYLPYDKGVFYGIQKVTFGQGDDKINVVSNAQIYLDLINDPARGEEQAEHLRKMRLRY
jgi:hypothetical protein